MIDFPASPINGQVFTSGAQSWTYDGTKWVASGVAAMPPLATGDNRIINGDMRIDQRNNGASGTAAGYTLDRWKFNTSQAAKLTWGQNLNGEISPTAFPYCLGFSTTSAFTAAAGDAFCVQQLIEADTLSDFAFGTVNAQPVTLSFWVVVGAGAPVGNYSGSLRNRDGTRSYPFLFPATNSWTKVVVTIPGDTAGTWTWALGGNAIGMIVTFDFGSGSNFLGSAGAWNSNNNTGVTGALKLVAATGLFYLTGVKLEVGSVATPFNRKSLAASMADCQRYYQKIGGVILGDIIQQGYVGAIGQNMTTTIGIATMRAAPTIAAVGSFTVQNVTSVSFFGGLQTVAVQLLSTAAGYVSWYNGTASTYLTASAEL